MTVIAFLAPWILIGIGVFYVAFWGGPGRAREAYLTRGRRLFGIVIPLIYIGIGIAVPAVVVASRAKREGNSVVLAQKKVDQQPGWFAHGGTLFSQNCAACHSLGAANARGVTGPNLDHYGQMTVGRVLSAIRIGGTGQGRMPAGILDGPNAKAVAQYVSTVAGK